MQDEITANIVGVVAPEVIGAEMRRARRKDAGSMNAWDCVMCGRIGMCGGLLLRMCRSKEFADSSDRA